MARPISQHTVTIHEKRPDDRSEQVNSLPAGAAPHSFNDRPRQPDLTDEEHQELIRFIRNFMQKRV